MSGVSLLQLQNCFNGNIYKHYLLVYKYCQAAKQNEKKTLKTLITYQCLQLETKINLFV